MSRLLSEKRIIKVDTSNGTSGANEYADGAVVVDATASAVYVSNGTNWTEVVLGSDVTLDTDLSTGASDTDAASALAAKTYTDNEIAALSIPPAEKRHSGGFEYDGTFSIGRSSEHEYGHITSDSDLGGTQISSSRSRVEVYNYSSSTFTITEDSGSPIMDVAANRAAVTIDILGSQKIVFVTDATGTNMLSAFRQSI